MKKIYKVLVFTVYPLSMLIILFYAPLLKNNEPARYSVAAYVVFGHLFLYFSLLVDCMHRDFATKGRKTLWFIGLLTMSLIFIPIYLFSVVFRDKAIL